MILKYVLAWFGMMILAIINGGFRDFAYKPYLGDLAAHQISTVILMVLFAGYFWFLNTIWPLRSASQAWMIGGIWFLMTEAFEFGVGTIYRGRFLEHALSRLQCICGTGLDTHSIVGVDRSVCVFPVCPANPESLEVNDGVSMDRGAGHHFFR